MLDNFYGISVVAESVTDRVDGTQVLELEFWVVLVN